MNAFWPTSRLAVDGTLTEMRAGLHSQKRIKRLRKTGPACFCYPCQPSWKQRSGMHAWQAFLPFHPGFCPARSPKPFAPSDGAASFRCAADLHEHEIGGVLWIPYGCLAPITCADAPV